MVARSTFTEAAEAVVDNGDSTYSRVLQIGVGSASAPITPANPLPVAPQIITISSSVTRSSDTGAYTINDLIANSMTAAQVVPMEFDMTALPRGFIRQLNIGRSTTAVDMGFRLHLFYAAPFAAGSYPADNAALYAAIAASAIVDGPQRMDITTASAQATLNSSVMTASLSIPYDASANNRMWGLLVAQNAVAMGASEAVSLSMICSSIA